MTWMADLAKIGILAEQPYQYCQHEPGATLSITAAKTIDLAQCCYVTNYKCLPTLCKLLSKYYVQFSFQEGMLSIDGKSCVDKGVYPGTDRTAE